MKGLCPIGRGLENIYLKRERVSYMNKKQTSKSVASKASEILRDSRYSAKSKSVAGSALSQTKNNKRK